MIKCNEELTNRFQTNEEMINRFQTFVNTTEPVFKISNISNTTGKLVKLKCPKCKKQKGFKEIRSQYTGLVNMMDKYCCLSCHKIYNYKDIANEI